MRHAARTAASPVSPTELHFDPAQILTLPCDVLVPAALERVIDAKVAENLKCRILAEGANGPTTPEADVVLDKRRDEIFVIPDILCNSGGVIVSYFEWVQDLQQLFWEEEEVTRREYQLPRPRLRDHDEARQAPTKFRTGPRRWRSASKRSAPPRIRGDCSRDHRSRPRRYSRQRYRSRSCRLPDAVCARAVVAQRRRRRRARDVHARQRDARTDGAERRQHQCATRYAMC